jgi:hypothetical protein
MADKDLVWSSRESYEKEASRDLFPFNEQDEAATIVKMGSKIAKQEPVAFGKASGVDTTPSSKPISTDVEYGQFHDDDGKRPPGGGSESAALRQRLDSSKLLMQTLAARNKQFGRYNKED